VNPSSARPVVPAWQAVVPADDTNTTRARILEVAAALLARFTVSKLTMEDVARAAGIARQTIYKHFSGKDDLLAELFVLQMEHNQYPVLRGLRQPPSAEALLTLFMTELNLARSYSLFNEVLDPAVAPRMAELVFSSEKMTAARESFWVPLLEEYERAGVLRPGLDHRAVVRWITYQEFWLLTHPTVLCDDDDTLTEYIRQFVIAALVRETTTSSAPTRGRARKATSTRKANRR
jgi:AcrR family transcriptional regulator